MHIRAPPSTIHRATNDDVGAAGLQPGAIRHGEDDDVKAVDVHIRGPSPTLHRATYDDVGAVAVQHGAIFTTSRDAAVTSGPGLPACNAAPSSSPVRRGDDVRTKAVGVQRGAISATSKVQRRRVRAKAAGVQRGAISTTCEARRRRVRAKAAGVQRSAIFTTSEARRRRVRAKVTGVQRGAISTKPMGRDENVRTGAAGVQRDTIFNSTPCHRQRRQGCRRTAWRHPP